jgi:hypothetical protein
LVTAKLAAEIVCVLLVDIASDWITAAGCCLLCARLPRQWHAGPPQTLDGSAPSRRDVVGDFAVLAVVEGVRVTSQGHAERDYKQRQMAHRVPHVR